MNNSSNNTRDEALFITQIVCYSVISIVGSLANVVICVGLLRGRLKSSEYFILNLAIADLLVCAIGIPLDIYLHFADSWPYGAFMCHVIYPSQTLLILTSILTLMGMSLERHRAICHPLKKRLTSKWICGGIALIWLIAVAAIVPYANALKYMDNDCQENWPENAKYYTLALFIIDYCIPLTIITYCYVRAGCVLNSKFKKFNRKESTSTKQNIAVMKRLKQNKKVIKIFSTAVVLFVICVLPGDCYWMWFSFRGHPYDNQHEDDIDHPYDNHLQAFSTIMLYANSAINPFIFGAFQMICHRKLKSRFSDQLTSTTGLSRSKGSGSSIGTGDGLARKAFSRTAVRKHVKYASLTTKNEATNAKGEPKNLNNTIQGAHDTKLIYRDTESRKTDTRKDCNDTNGEFHGTNNELRDEDGKTCDMNMNQKQVQQDTDNLCEANQFRDSMQTDCDAKERERDTSEEKRDTNQPQRDTTDASLGNSNETLQDATSISSDSSATLHRESDTFSLTSDTLRNTDCELTERSDNTEVLKVEHALDGSRNVHEPNTFINTRGEHRGSKGTENDDTKDKLQSTNAKTEEENFPKLEKSAKDNPDELSDVESTEFGLDKIQNMLESIGNKSIRETDL